MAVPRRSSQQNQNQTHTPNQAQTSAQTQPQPSLQSPPRSSSVSGAPAASPPMSVRGSAAGPPDTERELSGGMEASPASPDPAAPPLPSSSSFSAAASGGSSSSSPSSSSGPGSGAGSPTDGSSGIGGAFRELFEACRNGDVSRVKRLVDSVNVNAKDMAGRKSTPLHFAAGNDDSRSPEIN